MGGGSEGGGVYFVCSQPCRLPVSLVRARGRGAVRDCPRRGRVGRGQGVHGARPPWAQVGPGDRAGLGVAVRPECLCARRGVSRA